MVIEVAWRMKTQLSLKPSLELKRMINSYWKPKVTACYEKIWRLMPQLTFNAMLSKNKCKISRYEIFIEHHERTMKTTEKGNK